MAGFTPEMNCNGEVEWGIQSRGGWDGKLCWLTARMADGNSAASAWPLAANFFGKHAPLSNTPAPNPNPTPPPTSPSVRASFRANPFDFRLHEIPANNNLCVPPTPRPSTRFTCDPACSAQSMASAVSVALPLFGLRLPQSEWFEEFATFAPKA